MGGGKNTEPLLEKWTAREKTLKTLAEPMRNLTRRSLTLASCRAFPERFTKKGVVLIGVVTRKQCPTVSSSEGSVKQSVNPTEGENRRSAITAVLRGRGTGLHWGGGG